MTVDELMALQRDIAHRKPTTREKTAAAAFLAQFYNGLENIIKRIYRYHGLDLGFLYIQLGGYYIDLIIAHFYYRQIL